MKRPSWVHAFLILILSGILQPAVVAGESPGAARVLRVKAVADEAFRDNKNWEEEIRQHFEWADAKFRVFAGIGLELVAIERWTTHESKSMALLLNELRVKVDKGDADIVVGFTGHKAPKVLRLGYRGGVDLIRLPHIAGIAIALGDRAVVRRDDRFKKLTRHTLLHEIAHLFGGLHVKEKSILYTTSKRMDFVLDPFNQRVFELTRQRDFNRHIRKLSQEELNPVINLYREAPLRHERDFDTHIRIASLLLAAGEVDAAIEELEQAIDINPIAARPIFRAAIIPELEAYAEEHGTTTQIRYALGRAYSALREWEKAAHHLSSNCYTEPPHALSCSELGAVLLVGGKEGAEGAEEALRAALRLDESLMKAHNNLAILYAVLGRRSEALAHLNRATELRPDDPSVYHNMGMTYLKLKLLEPAADAFRHTLELNANDEKARSKLAVTLARQGETKQAR